MDKKKSVIILLVLLLISSFIFQFVRISKLNNETSLLKDAQGGKIHESIYHVSSAVADAKNDLASNNMSNLTRYSWQFNEFSIFAQPDSGFWGYYINIRNGFQELLKLTQDNSPKEKTDETKNILNTLLSKLSDALYTIKKDCGVENMKYYLLLDYDNNETMKNALKKLQ